MPSVLIQKIPVPPSIEYLSYCVIKYYQKSLNFQIINKYFLNIF